MLDQSLHVDRRGRGGGGGGGGGGHRHLWVRRAAPRVGQQPAAHGVGAGLTAGVEQRWLFRPAAVPGVGAARVEAASLRDRKSTRLNSSHSQISYAVFCLKKKKKKAIHLLRDILVHHASTMIIDYKHT